MILKRLCEKGLVPEEKWKLVLLFTFSSVIALGVTLQASYNFYQTGKNNYIESQSLLQWIDSNRHRFQSSAMPTQYPTASLLERVSIKADEHGISQERVQPQGEHRLLIWLNAVSFDHAVSWLNSLADDGIHIESIQIDNALIDGKVNVQCQLVDQYL